MSSVLAINNDFPIRTREPIHSGKVRAVYWLTPEDSARLIVERGYPVCPHAALAVMIVSDRISAFECIWRGQGGLDGVLGKGAALNAVSHHWFQRFQSAGLARSHVLEVPHPLVWIVQRAQPIKIEAIARRYITGSMWRSYDRGERDFCGIQLPHNLIKNQRLDELLITPSTKDVMRGLEGVPEIDDVNISRADIERHWQAFGFNCPEDIARYEQLLAQGFDVISDQLFSMGQLFVDTKFEFGYASNLSGERELIYMDEVGTPDSSRIWDASAYAAGEIIENSKEGFRQALFGLVPDPDVLTNKNRMAERLAFSQSTLLPSAIMDAVSQTYTDIAEKIIGKKLEVPQYPRREIVDLLYAELNLGV